MDVDEYIRKKVKPIFDAVAKEASKNRVSVGGGRSPFKSFVFYQPHNCRVYFDYKKPVKPTFGGSVVVKNSSELMFKDDFLGCRLTIKRNTVEVINKIDVDKRYIVHLSDSFSEVRDIIVSKIKESLGVFEAFLQRFGGSSSFKLVNFSIQDNKVESEVFVDSIPIKAKFRNEVVKKVYSERNVEFSDPSFAANYLTNQARLLEDFSVERWAADNISSFKDVFALEPVIRLLSFDNRLRLSEWAFNNLS